MGGRLDGKVAVITGAGSGIGRATALRFGAEGARVVVNDVDAQKADAVAAEVAGSGGGAVGMGGDVSNPADVDALVARAVDEFGGLHVMMNNAACPIPGLLADVTDDQWRQVMSVTLDGVFYGMRAALRVMTKAGGGSIVNTASGAGLGGEFALGAYGAAKAGVISLTRNAAVEYGAKGVRANAISPGPIATPPLLAYIDTIEHGKEKYAAQVPAGRLGQPEEIAALACFLASDESQYVNGTTMVCDGGIAARLASPKVG